MPWVIVTSRAHFFRDESAKLSVCGNVKLINPPGLIISNPEDWWPCSRCCDLATVVLRDDSLELEKISPEFFDEHDDGGYVGAAHPRNYHIKDADGVNKLKMVIVVRRDLKMRRGKEIAQACHAAMGAYNDSMDRWQEIGPDNDEWWGQCGRTKIVVKVNSEQELLDLAAEAERLNIGHCIVRDAGRTEVEPNTPTVLAIGPHYESVMDRITKSLELY